MLFDVNKMHPLYALRIGKPGSSFAFEIAQNIGLPQEILEAAKGKTDQQVLNYEQLLQDLENEKAELERQKEGFRIADTFLNEMVAKYNQLKSDLEVQRKKILSDAFRKAEDLINESNKRIENTIRLIKENKADKDKVKDTRKELKDFAAELQEKKEELNLTPEISEITPDQDTSLKVGDWVKIKDQEVNGQVLSFSGGTALIDVNGIHFRTSSSNLEPGEKQAWSSARHTTPPSAYFNINQRLADFRLSIDVRGKSVEESLSILRKYIDDAVLLSVSEISILHGKGDGILRQVIREYLKGVDEVESFEDEHVERGGTGITRVRLK
jgi:DNA mismatch repair protein MutS2